MSSKNDDRSAFIRVPSMAKSLLANESLSTADRLLIVSILAEGAGILRPEDVLKPTRNLPAFVCDTIRSEQRLMAEAAEDRRERRRARRENMSTDKSEHVQGQVETSPRTCPPRALSNGNGININTPNGVVGVCDKHVRFKSDSERVAEFREFYEAYPRQGNKPAALDEWNRAADAGELPPLADLLAALDAWKRSERWREGTRYIPHAGNWIKQRSWNDPPDGGEQKKDAAAEPEDPAMPCPPTPDDLHDPERRRLFWLSPAWRGRVEAWCRLNALDEWLADQAAEEASDAV